MDRSETYIKMSREAWQDDESYVPQVGDYAIRYIETSNRVGLVSMNRDQGVEHLYWHTLDEEDGLRLDAHPISILTRLIPLYRQDQLQEMAMAHRWRDEEQRPINAVVAELDHFQNWILEDCPELELHWSFSGEVSMEQLWLAFVKKEKHGKVWTGTEWKEA